MAKRKPKPVPPCRPVKGRPLRTKVLTDNGLNAEDRDICHLAASYIAAAFMWEETAEGVSFWGAVYERLLAIAEGAPLK